MIAETVKYTTTIVVSPEFRTDQAYLCFTMFYYMRGSSMTLTLDVGSGTVWHQSYDQGSIWRNVSVTIDELPKICSVKATVSYSHNDIIAIDDISVTEGACTYPTSK